MNFLAEWDLARTRVLCPLVLDKVASLFFRKRNISNAKYYALVVLFLLFEGFQLLTMIIANRPITPVLGVSFVVSTIGTLCIYAISWAHSYTRSEIEFALSRSPISEDAEKI